MVDIHNFCFCLIRQTCCILCWHCCKVLPLQTRPQPSISKFSCSYGFYSRFSFIPVFCSSPPIPKSDIIWFIIFLHSPPNCTNCTWKCLYTGSPSNSFTLANPLICLFLSLLTPSTSSFSFSTPASPSASQPPDPRQPGFADCLLLQRKLSPIHKSYLRVCYFISPWKAPQ